MTFTASELIYGIYAVLQSVICDDLYCRNRDNGGVCSNYVKYDLRFFISCKVLYFLRNE